MRASPRAKVGAKIVVKSAFSWEKERLGKKAVRKAYSKVELSTRAVEKAWNGVSMKFGVLVSSAM